MLSRVAVLALAALALGACRGDDDDGGTDPEVPRLEQTRVKIVSGDGQVAPVLSASTASAGLAPIQTPAPDVLPSPLIVTLVDVRTGMQLASVPEGADTYWYVPQQGCGTPFGGTVRVDPATNQAVNYWRRGTKTGVICEMQVGRIVGGQPVIDTVFTAEFEPGPPVDIIWDMEYDLPGSASPGDTLDLTLMVAGGWDAYHNTTTVEAVITTMTMETAWAQYTGGCSLGTEESHRATGWSVVVPAEVAEWPVSDTGKNACLHLYVDGKLRSREPMLIH